MRVPRPGRAGEDLRARAEARLGCDVVVVAAHSGRRHLARRTATRCPTRRTPRRWSPQQVPGIDAILVGHAHVEIPQRFVTQRAPPASRCCSASRYYWGMRLAVMDLELERHGQRLVGRRRRPSQTLNSNAVAEDPAGRRGRARPSTTRSSTYVNSADRHVDRRRCRPPRAVGRGRADHRLRQLRAGRRGASRASPAPTTRRCRCCRSRRRSTGPPSFPAGQVTLRDVAGLYIYDNTLLGVKVTGAQVQGLPRVLRALLQAGQRHRPVHDGRGHQRGHRHAPAPNGTPDYNFDSSPGSTRR